MKKRILLVALAVVMLFTCTACDPQVSGPTDPQPTTPQPTLPSYDPVEPVLKDNVYQLTEPCHVVYMAQHPDKAYALADDIDMYGYTWTPVDNFSGSLTGLIINAFNYTISNIVIEAKEGDTNVGLFRTVTGTIQEINFENITLNCPGTFTGNAGIVAGECKTAMTDVDVRSSKLNITAKDANVGLICGKLEATGQTCEATGDLNVTLAGGTSYVGGGFGYAANALSSCQIRTNVIVTGNGTAGAAGGVAGYLDNAMRDCEYIGHVTVSGEAAFAAGSLVGKLDSGSINNSKNCARSFNITGAVSANDYCGSMSSESLPIVACLKRDNTNIEDTLSEAERALRQQVVDYAYAMATYRWYPSQDIKYTDNCPGTPGRHTQNYKAGQVYFGMPYTHKSSSFAKFLSYLDENHVVLDSVPGTSEGLELFGNDCADLVYWSWAQVEADLTYTLTKDAICINGVLPVGDFVVVNSVATADSCAYNGAQVMYEAYAQVQMGDAVLYGPGHIRLAAEAAYVFRNADGSIDPNKSYIVTHEQGAGCANLNTKRTTCKVNGRYTFADLFSGNYIPVTMEAYAKGEADVLTATITNTDTTIKGVGSGIINANYRPDKVTLRVLDSKGNAVLDLKAFPADGTAKTSAALSIFRKEVKAMQLTAGQEYTYEVLLAAGGQEIVVQTFKFTA